MVIWQTLVIGVTEGSIYALLALGVVLVYRGSRVLNFAQAEIGTAGAFLAWRLNAQLHVPWPVTCVIAVAACVTIGVLFERLVASRLVAAPRVTVSVATVGLFSLIAALEGGFFAGQLKPIPGPVKGTGWQVAGVVISWSKVISLVLVLAVGLGLSLLLRRSDFGLGLLAAADDPQAVRLVGVRLWQVQAFTWGAGAGLSCIAALLIFPPVGGVSVLGTERLFVLALAAALVGGLTNLQGALIGGLAIGLVEAAARHVNVSGVEGLPTVLVFALVLIVLLARPQGLVVRTAR